MSEPRVVTEPLGGSPLSRAVAAGSLGARVAIPAPPTSAAWAVRAREVAGEFGGGWLDALRDAFGGAQAGIARLERTVAAGGVVFTAGQQAGMFGGPIYTWSKAIGALAVADALERETGIAAAPVFWAATDDADFVEANHTHVLVRGLVERLESIHGPPPGTPMARAPLGDLSAPLERLREACGSMANADAWHAVEAAYAGGATVGGAYVALLRALLEPLGIAVLDSSHAAVRSAGAALMSRALTRAPDVAAALDARHAWLGERGFEPQVSEVAGLSTVFVLEAGVKRRVRLAEAASLARTGDPAILSPNVLLRPVLERAILPTVAYVAGPGERAYFAQVSAVADALEARQPVAVSRWSCTIVEPAVDRAMARLGIRLDDLRDAAAIENRLARTALPGDVQRALAELHSVVNDSLEDLRRVDATGADGPLLRPEIIDGARRQIGFRVERLQRRLTAAMKRRGTESLRDLRMARDAIWPEGHTQERTLNFIPLLARYGPGLWSLMQHEADEHARALISGATRGG